MVAIHKDKPRTPTPRMEPSEPIREDTIVKAAFYTGIVLAIIFVSCLFVPSSEKKVDALVHGKYPNAQEIGRFGKPTRQTYVLCNNGRIVLVETDRSTILPRNRIRNAVVLAGTTCR